ncbi:YoaK family protein [Rhodococcus sp. KRD162]|uniref:YoaK family protein n=1 Tax=unclassified Rhodococcus (in: high G+C Gram-positive bacteria) TaxID=192944 RepID=UPI0019D1564B|nr:YoaK family protein [Rhodococcus sp. KRD162]
MTSPVAISRETAVGAEARLSWILSGLAGMVGAVAFLHSAGYFVTFMTGNTERAVVGHFGHPDGKEVAPGASPIAALALMGSFLTGVVVSSICRRRYWSNHPHGATVLTTVALAGAASLDIAISGWSSATVNFYPILLVAFALGALNTAFTKKEETYIPLSYVTGTLVKLGQGIERHLCGGGTYYDWLCYSILLGSFALGGAIGAVIGVVITGPQVLLIAALISLGATIFTFTHTERRSLLG